MNTPLELLNKKRATSVKHLEEKGKFSKKRVYVGMATCEIAAGSKEVMEIFQSAVADGLDIYISQKGCVGKCSLEPTVDIIEERKEPVFYTQVTPQKAKEIIESHLKKDVVLEEYRESLDMEKQQRIALKNCGVIDPESLDDYLSVKGYEALAKVLSRGQNK